ncbi:MAG TPA: hypothetical protein VK162_18480 [Streptosporangiaceae bacterium]|nr:hypothetical protein [Streptosporangiaceae bacterium]
MTFLDEPGWRGQVYQGGWTRGGGDAAVIEPATGEASSLAA